MSASSTELILVSGGLVHPGLLVRRALRRAIGRERYSIRRVRSPEALVRLDRRLRPVTVLLMFHRKRQAIAPAGFVDSLLAILEAGATVIAIHAATASFKADERYAALLGARFTGHDRPGRVLILPESSPARAEIAPFTLRDELYRHEFHADCVVHASASTGEPVLWTRSAGNGTVLYLSLGHRAGTFRNPGVRAIIQAALRGAFA